MFMDRVMPSSAASGTQLIDSHHTTSTQPRLFSLLFAVTEVATPGRRLVLSLFISCSCVYNSPRTRADELQPRDLPAVKSAVKRAKLESPKNLNNYNRANADALTLEVLTLKRGRPFSFATRNGSACQPRHLRRAGTTKRARGRVREV